MAKILVADDNSNIQKMVGLALKDQGIDVVAVGNGEAAVRKISDARPDLVLADVFMPVRNGYEVCQFVKTDPALAHIPVILLVGAFDPLDEQEAQRVGADGVLKKPFVPADPLISMVKSALQRSGGAHGNAGDIKGPEPGNLQGVDLLPSGAPKVPTLEAIPAQTPHEAPVSAAVHESFVDEVPPRPEEVRIDSSAHPVAFGSLLETPAEETAADESFETANSPEFAVERDWRDRDEAEAAEEEEEEEEEEPAAWRPEGSEEEVPADKSKKSKSSASDWRTGGFEQIAAGKSRGMGWEPEEEEEKPDAVETVPTASNNLTETSATPVAAQETTAVPTTLGSALRGTAGSSVSREKKPAETTTAMEETTHVPSEKQASTDKEEAKDSWFSVSPSPWDVEIQKANQLASTWDAPTATDTLPDAANKKEQAIEGVGEETKAVIEEAALPPATVEAIREEAVQVTEDAEFVLETEAPSEGTSFYAPEEEGMVEPTSPPPASTPSMDDLVAKVLAKMDPEVLQAVTREILKPVVEAMVKEELKSKKQ